MEIDVFELIIVDFCYFREFILSTMRETPMKCFGIDRSKL